MFAIGLINFEILIYNKWGQELYQNKNIGWDGTFKNKDCQDGIYSYKIIAEDFQQKSHFYFGEVSLLR